MTSRGVYRSRRICLLTLSADEMPGVEGVGECAPLPQLSCDDLPDYEEILQQACDNFCTTGRIDSHRLRAYPSILFGLETTRRQHGTIRYALCTGRRGNPYQWIGVDGDILRDGNAA